MSNRDKDAEILALRHQITVLERQLGAERVRFSPSDRAFLAALLHRLPSRVLRRIRLVVLRLARENSHWGYRREPPVRGPGVQAPDPSLPAAARQQLRHRLFGQPAEAPEDGLPHPRAESSPHAHQHCQGRQLPQQGLVRAGERAVECRAGEVPYSLVGVRAPDQDERQHGRGQSSGLCAGERRRTDVGVRMTEAQSDLGLGGWPAPGRSAGAVAGFLPVRGAIPVRYLPAVEPAEADLDPAVIAIALDHGGSAPPDVAIEGDPVLGLPGADRRVHALAVEQSFARGVKQGRTATLDSPPDGDPDSGALGFGAAGARWLSGYYDQCRPRPPPCC